MLSLVKANINKKDKIITESFYGAEIIWHNYVVDYKGKNVGVLLFMAKCNANLKVRFQNVIRKYDFKLIQS